MAQPKTPAFGALLRSLRQARGKRASLEAVAQDLARIGVADVAPSTIWRYEAGRVPDVVVLAGLARIYGQNVLVWLAALTEEVSGRPLVDIDPRRAEREAVWRERWERLKPEAQRRFLRYIDTEAW